MKTINDRYGHEAGDLALRDVAELLRETFRTSDVIARLGGDEFAVWVSSSPNEVNLILARMSRKISLRSDARPYNSSISTGVARFEPGVHHSLEDLMNAADQVMYDQKMHRARRARILAIDDDPDFLQFLEISLRREYEVVTAISLEEGLGSISEGAQT